jgi:DNA polymerase-3 subunit delta'
MSNFKQVVGQTQAVELLQQAIAQNRIAPAYLFSGPNGVGRGLVAKCFCELLLCHRIAETQHQLIQQKLSAGNHPDLLWVQPTYQHQGKLLTPKEAEAAGVKRKAPPQIRIEQIRDITHFLARPPLEATRTVVVIEESHTMTEAAANGLLKTLEEPGRATLILIAPSIDNLLPTLVSRCQRIPFYRLATTQIKDILQQNGYAEIFYDLALLDIAQGSPGEAIASWSQWQTIPEEIREKLKKWPKNPLEGLELAKIIAQELDTQVQLWLVDYLQYYYWRKQKNPQHLKILEKTRQALLAYVQPRLVWECTFINNL